MIGALDLFKIGIGPSSSHTMAPMIAAHRFRGALPAASARVTAELFGSLAWTGRGHGTDTAIALGLLGQTPSAVDPDAIAALLARLSREKAFPGPRERPVTFDPAVDILFSFETLLPRHANAMTFRAFDGAGKLVLQTTYYSLGGGFVVEEGEPAEPPCVSVPYPFATARELLGLCEQSGLSIAALQMQNEAALRPPAEVDAALDAVHGAMQACIDRGLSRDGLLPGPFGVERRAKALMEKLVAGHGHNAQRPHEVMDWVATWAIAVNEENAAGGRVVTAPTNGAAGIIPAVLRYAETFCGAPSQGGARIFLLTAAAIGSIIKTNASISGAEVGCQGEVGSAASMAASGLAAVLGGTPRQIENAAEIAMEHHLGMTCDPIGGLVQIPCIERNAFGASKAIMAASLALRGDGTHKVSFDQVIETMRQTGADMQSKYKETAQGGLAVNVTEC